MDNLYSNRHTLLLALLVLIFVLLLFSGIKQIYHQDEYRWVAIADGSDSSPGPHPPLTAILLRYTGQIFGFDRLRILPAFFAVINLILIYIITAKLTGSKNIGLLAAGFFIANVYSLIAGLQVDIDGALLPFFVLLFYLAYLYFQDGKKWAIALLFLSLVGGFITKLSFALAVGAVMCDYFLSICRQHSWDIKTLARKNMPLILGSGLFTALGYLFFSSHFPLVVQYAKHFKSFNFGSRAYPDFIFKVVKSIVLLSPVPVLLAGAALYMPVLVRKNRFWLIYLFLNIIFYTVLFDFTTLTIERYFMFMIAPISIIGAQVFYRLTTGVVSNRFWLYFGVSLILLTIVGYALLMLPHVTLPLNPKIAYLKQVEHFRFNFLIPFTGGSGPIGFYFSARFIIFSWLVSLVSMLAYWLSVNRRALWLAVFVAMGLVTNFFLVNEFLSGELYGSAPDIARKTVDYVNQSPGIKSVITYYDIAPYDLRLSGKYASRFYTAPTRDYTAKIASFRGQYMIVNFPEIGTDSIYWGLINRCPLLKSFQDKYIYSYIYDCQQLKPEKKK